MRKLRQRHHHERASLTSPEPAPLTITSDILFEVIMTFSAVATFAQPLDPIATNEHEILSYVSNVIEKESNNGDTKLGGDHVGYAELIKKRIQNLDEEGAGDALTFWNSVASLSLITLSTEPIPNDTDTLPNMGSNEGSTSILKKENDNDAFMLLHLNPSYKPLNDDDGGSEDLMSESLPNSMIDSSISTSFSGTALIHGQGGKDSEEDITHNNVNEVDALSSTSLLNNFIIESSISSSYPSPNTILVWSQDEENMKKEPNRTGAIANITNSTQFNNSSNISESLPPKSENDNPNKLQTMETISLALGISVAIIAIILLISHLLYIRWERNIGELKTVDTNLTFDNVETESSPSSAMSPT
eukprot:8363086-Ditylum_brightwellii.AAC.1